MLLLLSCIFIIPCMTPCVNKKIKKSVIFMENRNKSSASRLKANKKYLSKFVDIKIRVTPKERERLQEHALDMGESVASFIKRAIREAMLRDNSEEPK